MGDKEPRRRKKRRDSQKKDDVRPEEHFFVPTKTEPRDSDLEVEEEIVIHSHHQPSNLAKIVFVILFSGLVVSLSFIFISLRDTEKSSFDSFDVSHEEAHGEALHDEHTEEALHPGDHHDDHEDEVRLEDFISGLSSMFSQKAENVDDDDEEDEEAVPSEEKHVAEDSIDLGSIEPESSTDQGILEEYVEETSEQPPPEESIEEPVSSSIYPETTTPYPEELYSTYDYLESEEFSTPTAQPDPPPPPKTPKKVPEPVVVDDDDEDEQDSFSIYERADITNEADFDIRDHLDALNDILDKESNEDDDDNDEGDDDDEDDDDDDEKDEGVEEEFDFWQF